MFGCFDEFTRRCLRTRRFFVTSGDSAVRAVYNNSVDVLTFVIPVRHQANAPSWARLREYLAQTLRSIAAQTDPRWRAIIVANHGADLPDLPAQVSVTRVDFPPNPHYTAGSVDMETFYENLRLDKGRRLLAGMMAAQPMRYVMVVDDDDFVHRRLTAFVAAHDGENGWSIRNGLVWSTDRNLVYKHSDFSNFCGTSHVIRADLLKLPEHFADASDDYVKRMLGSHRFVSDVLAEAGTPLAPLPFDGAVYRIGHAGAATRSGTLRHQFFPRNLIVHPRELARRLARLRPLTPAIRRDFFGG